MPNPRFRAVAVHGLKGGVGKSSCSAALALKLASHGFRVGLLDADLDSPFLSEALGLKGKVTLNGSRAMVPVEHMGIKVMSFASYVPTDFAGATMRGEYHAQWIRDAVNHAEWGGTELLIVDMPAGSSDEFLSLKQLFPDNLLGLVVVAMPNLTTSLQRVYNTASFHHLRILGAIENMSGEVFGSGAVAEFCEAKRINFFGSIPLDARIRAAHQRGDPLLPEELAEPIREAAHVIARLLTNEVEAR